jgi:hypothetical protein
VNLFVNSIRKENEDGLPMLDVHCSPVDFEYKLMVFPSFFSMVPQTCTQNKEFKVRLEIKGNTYGKDNFDLPFTHEQSCI